MESRKQRNHGAPTTWDAPAIAILCTFFFLLGAVAYKFLLWRWLP